MNIVSKHRAANRDLRFIMAGGGDSDAELRGAFEVSAALQREFRDFNTFAEYCHAERDGLVNIAGGR